MPILFKAVWADLFTETPSLTFLIHARARRTWLVFIKAIYVLQQMFWRSEIPGSKPRLYWTIWVTHLVVEINSKTDPQVSKNKTGEVPTRHYSPVFNTPLQWRPFLPRLAHCCGLVKGHELASSVLVVKHCVSKQPTTFSNNLLDVVPSSIFVCICDVLYLR